MNALSRQSVASHTGLEMAAVAANRFGLGARPDELRAVAGDPRGWLIAQLDRDVDIPAPIAELPPTGSDLIAFAAFVRNAREGQRSGLRQVPSLRTRYHQAVDARMRVAVETDLPFRERLVRFWSNHFVVSGAKPSARAMPPSFETDVARRHVCGTFREMLHASSKHPAMLFYLDNFISIGPNSDWGRNPDRAPDLGPVLGRPSGLNENLAREILELHTVGVDGPYGQEDVTAFARALTGWGASLGGARGDLSRAASRTAQQAFRFNPAAHEPGAETVMGVRYGQTGVAKGEAILDDLAAHPATARFIAGKLARHFVSDTPPAALVERLAQRFQETGGDLRELAIALVEADEAWTLERTKYKRPEEYAVSAARALGGPFMTGAQWAALLEGMGQPPFNPPGPDGWPDQAADWLGPDGLWKRIEWALQASSRTVSTQVEPSDFAAAVLGPLISAQTSAAVESAETPDEAIALVVTSPEFLWR